MTRNYIFKIIIFALFLCVIFSGGNRIYIFQGQKINSEEISEKSISNTAKSLFYEGNLEKSREYYLQLKEQKPDNTDVLKNLIVIERELGNLMEVERLYSHLISLKPDDLNILFEYAVFLYQTGNYENAAKQFNEIIVEYKTSENQSRQKLGEIYYYTGKVYRRQGKEDKALSFFERGIVYNEAFPLNYVEKGEIYYRKDMLGEANRAFLQALNRDSSLSSLYPHIAEVFERSNNYKQAYNFWKRSKNSNISKERAENKIDNLVEKYPHLKTEEEEKKKISRTNIEWTDTPRGAENPGEIEDIRIGLINSAQDVSFQVGSDFVLKVGSSQILTGNEKTEWKIIYDDSGYNIYSNDELLKVYESKEPLQIIPEDENATSVIYNINYGSGYFWAGEEDRRYRGKLELYPLNESNRFNLINIINAEEYLYSVIASEMPAWWPEEALKTQSIAARSYLYFNLDRHEDEGYDLCDTVHCAVYKGLAGEHKNTRQAVDATRGEVVKYDEKIINAVFSSNSGGYTESSKEIWGTEVPYLSGVNNMQGGEYDFPLSPSQLEVWIKNKSESFSDSSRYTGSSSYRWVKAMPASYLEEKYNLGDLKKITPTRRSKGGSIQKLLISGTERNIELNKDKIRSGLGGLRSNRFILRRIYTNNTINEIIIYGSGWGHNVGLDQTGAAGMAEENYDYKEIIRHYYPGTEIVPLY
ncbi:MAG: SpoIID/LytB domain-containing protein [Halanaerobiales bacterium]